MNSTRSGGGASTGTRSAWVPISERWPEDGQPCFTYLPIINAISYHRFLPELGSKESWKVNGITHWMPLPEPPEGHPRIEQFT